MLEVASWAAVSSHAVIMLFLVVLGGAAVLEVHRALHHGGNGDVKALRERESALRKQLQVISVANRTSQRSGRSAASPPAVGRCRALSPATAQLSELSGIFHRSWRRLRSDHGCDLLQTRIQADCLPPLLLPLARCSPAQTGTQRSGTPTHLPTLSLLQACGFARADLVQDIQRELRATQQQRELTEAEAAQLAAVNTRLTAENATLASTTAHLTAGASARFRSLWISSLTAALARLMHLGF